MATVYGNQSFKKTPIKNSLKINEEGEKTKIKGASILETCPWC
jgi:hypothetical protein